MKRMKIMVGWGLLVGSLLSASLVKAATIVPVEVVNNLSTSILGSTVIPYKEVTLSAQTAGVVKFIAGEVGTAFPKEVALVQIDESQLLAKRNAVLAQIQNAQAALRSSEVQYNRELISPRSKDVGAMPGFGLPAIMDQMFTKPMADTVLGGYNSEAVRYSDLMTSANHVSQANGMVQQALSQLQEVDAALRNTQAIAPFEGIILQKLVEVGDAVQPGQPLLRIGFMKYMRLLADVPAGMINQLQEGMEIDVRIDGVSDMTKAKVTQIYPLADPERHTITVKLDLPTQIQTKPGVYAELLLPANPNSVAKTLLIPETAILRGRSLPSVLVVANNKSELRLVRTGSVYGSKIEIVSGLKPNEQVIDNPPPKVGSGWMPSAETATQPN
ncbi:efflux RND transporter periplasmic adaptor subunit [Thiofilum flexile]|uniref:efflux RND transporter periplasmic adaptor subunit n=1 Tax=Thiofilum flexile TaxID=125627 RepID=UPI001FE0D7FD|nr:efflux RND transporter periplasmic adaptor subunit [Thiofilum flexile]